MKCKVFLTLLDVQQNKIFLLQRFAKSALLHPRPRHPTVHTTSGRKEDEIVANPNSLGESRWIPQPICRTHGFATRINYRLRHSQAVLSMAWASTRPWIHLPHPRHKPPEKVHGSQTACLRRNVLSLSFHAQHVCRWWSGNSTVWNLPLGMFIVQPSCSCWSRACAIFCSTRRSSSVRWIRLRPVRVTVFPPTDSHTQFPCKNRTQIFIKNSVTNRLSKTWHHDGHFWPGRTVKLPVAWQAKKWREIHSYNNNFHRNGHKEDCWLSGRSSPTVRRVPRFWFDEQNWPWKAKDEIPQQRHSFRFNFTGCRKVPPVIPFVPRFSTNHIFGNKNSKKLFNTSRIHNWSGGENFSHSLLCDPNAKKTCQIWWNLMLTELEKRYSCLPKVRGVKPQVSTSYYVSTITGMGKFGQLPLCCVGNLFASE